MSFYPHFCAAWQRLVGPVNDLARTIDNDLAAIVIRFVRLDGQWWNSITGFGIGFDNVLVDMYYFFHLFPFVSLIITEVCSLSTPKKLACPLYLPYLAEAYNRQDTPTHQYSVARLPLIGLTVTQANFEHSGLSPVCLYQLHFIILYISTLSTPNFIIK